MRGIFTSITQMNSKSFFRSVLLALTMSCGLWPAFAQPNTATPAPKPDTWYVEQIMMTLDAASRFVGSSVISNPGSVPVYVRTSAERVAVVNGQRQRFPVDDGSLRVYPEEFVLRPGDSFTARIVSDPSKFQGDSQSFYIKFVDISDTKADASAPGIQNAFLLGFEVLVSVNKSAVPKFGSDQFKLARLGHDYELTNLTGHHLYLNGGGICPAGKPLLVDCKPVTNFPRQSLLPNETVKFPTTAEGNSIGILVSAGLNQRDRAVMLYFPPLPPPTVQ